MRDVRKSGNVTAAAPLRRSVAPQEHPPPMLHCDSELIMSPNALFMFPSISTSVAERECSTHY